MNVQDYDIGTVQVGDFCQTFAQLDTALHYVAVLTDVSDCRLRQENPHIEEDARNIARLDVPITQHTTKSTASSIEVWKTVAAACTGGRGAGQDVILRGRKCIFVHIPNPAGTSLTQVRIIHISQ
jgi:hypothetical protein